MIGYRSRPIATGVSFVLGVILLAACSAGPIASADRPSVARQASTPVGVRGAPQRSVAAPSAETDTVTPAQGRAEEIVTGLSPMLCGMGLCNDRRPAPTTEPYVIRNDGGGQIISAEADREMLARWGGRVEIRESCRSACVIFTTLPNACLGPGLRIGFHSADVNRGFVGNQQIAKYLRGDVRRRFLEEWQYVPNDEIRYIPARAYKRLDPQVKICGQD